MQHDRHHAVLVHGEHPEECDGLPHWKTAVKRGASAPPQICALPRECLVGEDEEHRRDAYDGLEQVGAADDDCGGAALGEHFPLRIKWRERKNADA